MRPRCIREDRFALATAGRDWRDGGGGGDDDSTARPPDLAQIWDDMAMWNADFAGMLGVRVDTLNHLEVARSWPTPPTPSRRLRRHSLYPHRREKWSTDGPSHAQSSYLFRRRRETKPNKMAQSLLVCSSSTRRHSRPYDSEPDTPPPRYVTSSPLSRPPRSARFSSRCACRRPCTRATTSFCARSPCVSASSG